LAEGKTVQLTMNPQTARYGAHVLDTYGAPHLSELTECGAPPLDRPPNHLGAFILTTLFVKPLGAPQHRLLYMFGRRTLNAVYEYNVARDFLLQYVQKLPQTNNHFLRALDAITHFEQCIASAAQADLLFERMIAFANLPKVDVDRCNKIRLIWNRSKHFDEDLKNPTVDLISPVWLTNTAIASSRAVVTFDELHSVLTDLLSVFTKTFGASP
jgi:hypothetical protein